MEREEERGGGDISWCWGRHQVTWLYSVVKEELSKMVLLYGNMKEGRGDLMCKKQLQAERTAHDIARRGKMQEMAKRTGMAVNASNSSPWKVKAEERSQVQGLS